MSQITIEEFIDFIQSDITIYGTLPKDLPDAAIRQFVETSALPWFYQYYKYAVTKMYYVLFKEYFNTEEYINTKYVQLPCEIQSITWIFRADQSNIFSLGLNVPNLSVNLGVTNQPYLSSYLSTIGELGVYKAMIDGMADMLNQMNLYTVKFDFNYSSHRLTLMGSNANTNLILECMVNIPNENLFTDPLFVKYVTGWAKQQYGNLYNRFDFSYQGNIKINGSDLIANGKEEMKEVIDEIKGISNSSFFFMVKR